MEAIIKVSPDELDFLLFSKIKELIGGRQNFEVTITLSEKNAAYLGQLEESISQLNETDQTVYFSFDEFMSYPNSKS